MLNRISQALVTGAAALLLACGGSAAGGDTDTTPTGSTEDPVGEGESEQVTEDVPSEGLDLGPEAVEKGAEVYGDSCSFCHGDDLAGAGDNPALVGADALSDYADDQALLDYVAAEMPKDDPGSLSDEEYRAVVAFLRSKNM